MNLDPVVALAGAAANSGLHMLAKELLSHGASVSISLYVAEDDMLLGCSDLGVASIIDDRIKDHRPVLRHWKWEPES